MPRTNLAFTDGRHLSFVPFLCIPWVVFYQTAPTSYISRICISPHIPQISPHWLIPANLVHICQKPSILLIRALDEVWRLKTTVTTLVSKRATPAVMRQLQDHGVAHFSCHGMLETGKPLEGKLFDVQDLPRPAPHTAQNYTASTSLCRIWIPFHL